MLNFWTLNGPTIFVGSGASVAEAFQNWFVARPDLQALTSDHRLWYLEADEGTELPYVEFFKVSEADAELTTGTKARRAEIQVNCYAASSSAAIAIADAFQSAYDRAPLVIKGQQVSHCIPGAPTEGKGEGKGPGGEDCYSGMITFDILYGITY